MTIRGRLKLIASRITSLVDFEDLLYFTGLCAVSAGCWLVFPPAGYVSAGLFLMLPALVSMFRRKGPAE